MGANVGGLVGGRSASLPLRVSGSVLIYHLLASQLLLVTGTVFVFCDEP